MAINQPQQEIIKQFAKQLGYQDADFVDEHGLALLIDNKVQINILNQQERCLILAYIAPLDDENRLKLYETLLDANHDQDALGGASLGICPRKKSIALSLAIDSEGLDVSLLQQVFDRVLEASLLWHDRLKNQVSELQVDEAPDLPLATNFHAVMA
ncbi:type III secretion system chaperone [Thalassomonas sp. RHCl1]|uniref:type III secretion system chaperone n=1 Tax=Thalassomonas sp. RHCl1 TaxID=2995320 RepID=UPI00248B8A61|nr:type III secretion system chaperone [Thalassomonas sp. RHCl1]